MVKRNFLVTLFAIALLLQFGSVVHAAAGADATELGNITFLNSGSPEAQPDFIKGVLFLHNFEYDQARRAFRRAQSINPSFAMAYWGEAMTYHQSLWSNQWQTEGQRALLKLGSTTKKRMSKAPTQRERDYIKATETLFGLTTQSKGKSKYERDVLYRDQMRRLHAKYPNDLEATTFYGLSILGVGSANRGYTAYMKAAAVLTEVWDVNRLHPGAVHYLIHSYDDPVHAVLGVPMARAYSKIAPDAAHAQHMTSHIFVALGLWDDVVAANLRALKVASFASVDTDEMSREESHYFYWLQYARLQQGRTTDAEDLLKFLHERLDKSPSPRERAYYGAMFARYIIDTEDWNAATKWAVAASIEIPTTHYYFAQAFAAIKLGQLEGVQQIIDQVRPSGQGNPEIVLNKPEIEVLHLELEALMALANGNGDTAVTLLRQAVAMELKMPFKYGPPRLIKPTGELLGDVLLELGQTREAVQAYQDQLSRTPQRTHSLLGLARAASAHGDESTSGEAYHRLFEIWHDAEITLPAIDEVRIATGSHDRRSE